MTCDSRILFVDQTGKLGGAELCLADIAIHLRDRCSVFLFEEGPFKDLLEKGGVDTLTPKSVPQAKVRKNSKGLVYLLAVPAFLRLVVSLTKVAIGYDLLYANTAKALVATAIVALILRKPYLFHLHDIIDAQHFNFLNRWLLVTAANLATGVIANSQATADAYRKAGGNNRNLTVIPNGFRPERFRTDTTAQSHSLRRAMEAEGKPLVGLFGRITEWKGQKVLIRALSLLPMVNSVIVGDALFTDEDQRYKRELVDLAKQLGVADRLHFAGFQADTLPFFNAIDLVVHCSVSPEPFGRVIAEGLLAGRPVVATKGGGVSEILEDGVTGVLVSPDDPRELAGVIEQLLGDRSRADRLASTGQDAVSRRFALDRVLDQWTDFINRTIRRPAPDSKKAVSDKGEPLYGKRSYAVSDRP